MRDRSVTRLPGIFLLVLVTVLVIQSPVFAQENQTTAFYPTDDAYVDLLANAVNFGTAPQLEVSWSSVQIEGGNKLQIDRLSYLKFDLAMSKGSIIRSAFLKVFVTKAVTGSSVLIVLPVGDKTWTEATLTGNNAPDMPSSEKEGRAKSINEVKITELNTWYSLDITSYARSIRSGLLSVLLTGGNSKTPFRDIIYFNSKETGDQTLRPFLEVNFTPGQGDQGGQGGKSLVYLTLRSSHYGGSAYVNATEHKFPENLEIVLDAPTGQVRIAVSDNISINDRVRAIFTKWGDGSTENPRNIALNDSLTLKAIYTESYYVNVTTQYGVTTGAGWYNGGSSVTSKVSGDSKSDPPRVQADGILGMLGVSYVFDHWSGYTDDSSNLRVVVDGPLTVTAMWRPDYSLLYLNLLRVVMSVGAGSAVVMIVRRRMSSTQQPTGMKGEQQHPDIGRRGRSGLTLPSIGRVKPAATPISRTSAARAAPTRPRPFMRAMEPARAPSSVGNVDLAPPTRRYGGGESADSFAGVIGRRQLVRENTGDPAPAAASTTVTSQSPIAISKFCVACGVKIPRDSKYCEECGKKQV